MHPCMVLYDSSIIIGIQGNFNVLIPHPPHFGLYYFYSVVKGYLLFFSEEMILLLTGKITNEISKLMLFISFKLPVCTFNLVFIYNSLLSASAQMQHMTILQEEISHLNNCCREQKFCIKRYVRFLSLEKLNICAKE